MPTDTAVPKPKRPKRNWKIRLLRWSLLLIILWLIGTFIPTLLFTRRLLSPSPEPTPQITWGTLEQVRLTTSDNQSIGACVNRKGDRPSVVLFLHGIGDTRGFWLEQIHAMEEAGYASMAITFRAHGDSTGRIEDFGYSSQHDVVAAVRYLCEQFPGRPVVLVGNSLGSAAAIYAARTLNHEVNGYFLESPYRDLASAVRSRTNAAPPPFNWLAFQGMRMWGKMLIPEKAELVSPIDNVTNIPADVPVTFVAAGRDRWCQLWEVRDLYQAIQSHAQLVIIDSDRHGACSRSDAGRYHAALQELLKKVDSGNGVSR